MKTLLTAVITAALFSFSAAASAQTEPTKPAEPAKKDAKKAPPKKTTEKKTTEKKKPPAKKTEPVKVAPGTKAELGPGTYTTGPTTLRDKDGKVIPTSPDAYNIDSAKKK